MNDARLVRDRFRLILLSLICLGLAWAVPGCAIGGASPAPTLALEECRLTAPGVSVWLPARCGSQTVFEDRAAGSGRQIELAVAVIPAVSRDPAPDPLFFLTGGPGQAATEAYVMLAPAFARVGDKRDIVLVDQRGTGRSNRLACPNQEEGAASARYDSETAKARLAECLAELDADPALYTTSQAVDDLDEVREALGYERINLYGVSYGTRVALEYLRRYPDRVRAVILDGVVPPEVPLGSQVAPDAQRALDLMFDRCAADEACREAFPRLREEFASLLAKVREEPVPVALAHPVTGRPIEIAYGHELFAGSLRLLTYAPETVALLPLLIHHTHETGEFDLLAAQSLLVTEQLADSIAEGMHHSVVCAEDYPFLDQAELRRAADGTYLGDLLIRALADACAVWPRGEAPAGFPAPVAAAAPVLLLSGEADPVTPPANAELAARGLERSLHLVAPGQGHGVVLRGCLPKVATSFIELGAVEGLEVDCVRDMRPSPFFVDFLGPRP